MTRQLHPKVSRLYPRLLTSKKRILLLRGGSGSTKTYSVCQAIAIWLATGVFLEDEPLNTGVFSIVRKHSATHDKAALRDFKEIINNLEVRDLIIENKTNKTFTFDDGRDNRVVEFFGADDEQKVRGPRRHYLYCNEANELNFLKEFNQLNMRTRKRVVLDFNPDDPDNWLNQEIELKRAITEKDVDILVSTHHDNPFMSDVEHKEIEGLKNIDEALWRIYAKGEYGRMVGQIFSDTQIIRNGIPTKAKFVAYGLDFGYSNHPSALTAVYVIQYDNPNKKDDIFLKEIFYETEMTNDDIADRLDAMGIDKHDQIYADSAEPKSIEEIKRKGYNIRPAKKGRDSINYGINLMKQYNLWSTEESLNIQKEFRKYKWKEGSDGEPSNKPIDAFNHAIDGIRYVFMQKMLRKRGPTVIEKIFGQKKEYRNPFDTYD